MAVRNLIPVLGDQLSPSSPLLRLADPAADVFVMGEVAAEINRHPNHRQRVILFLSAMRHFRDDLRSRGFTVYYQELSDPNAHESLDDVFRGAITKYSPEQIVMLEPGRADIEKRFRDIAGNAHVGIEVLDDPHFFLTRDEFADWAAGRKSFLAETFYRMMRRRTGYLMDGDRPAGGSWNYDRLNRRSFSPDNSPAARPPLRFPPDEITRRVSDEVVSRCPSLTGSAESFGWPVTRDQADQALDDFVAHRLPLFGAYQDAMWTGDPWLYHSALSAALNLRMLDPRVVVERALRAYEDGVVPLHSVEGFVRQIIGWREFIRGLYWYKNVELQSANALEASENLPDLFWTGDTSMRCLSEVVGQVLNTGYAHHIQRLMVAGLFCQLYGVDPRHVHDWFMALYVDSVEWVTLPNTVGMSQYADGGIVGTKPYIASGKYIDRMSNHCRTCRFDPARSTGDEACPFTTLYWDFIGRNCERLEANSRTVLQVRNYRRKSTDERRAITQHARSIRAMIAEGQM